MSNIEKCNGTRLEWNEIKTILDRHAYMLTNYAPTAWHGLGLGNADMGATIFGQPQALTFRLAKMDLWDNRMPKEFFIACNQLTLSELKRKVEEMSADPKFTSSRLYGPVYDLTYPCIRMAGDLTVRICKYWLQSILQHTQKLYLSDGRYEGRFLMGYYWPSSFAEGTVEAFTSWQRNVMAVKIAMPPAAANRVAVTLWRDPYGGRTWEMLSPSPLRHHTQKVGGFTEDPRNGMLPPCRMTVNDRQAVVQQVIPGDEACPDREFAIVGKATAGEFALASTGEAVLELGKARELILFVAIASEQEGVKPLERAIALADQAEALGWDGLYREHADAWRQFWMKSFLSVEDDTAQRIWVRQTQIAAMSQRAGKPPQGLFGVNVPCDSPCWRGDRHNNWPEYSSRFWADYGANHEEQALNYAEFVLNYLPKAKRIARDVFECERGAFYPCVTFGETERYCMDSFMSRSLYLAAIHAQNLWWHYEYFGNREFLARYAYPVMRECALFYVELLKKNPPDDYTLWPTVPAETTGWTRNFEFNRNCIEDIAHVKFLMRAVLEAAGILGQDAELQPVWRRILENLPAYPTVRVGDRDEFTDMAGRKERFEYNHAVPFAPLWPAEDPDVVHEARWREIARNTLDIDNINFQVDLQRVHMAALRLGMKQRVWHDLFDHADTLDDNSRHLWLNITGNDNGKLLADGICRLLFSGSSLVVQEMLLSSWDGIIRLFPGWPDNKAARFQNLRAKGAFLVSASWRAGKVETAEIVSEKGKPIRIAQPWVKVQVRSEDNQVPDGMYAENGILHFDTVVGGKYYLRRR